MHWAVCRPWKDRPSCQSPLWGALRLPFGQFSVVAALVVLAHVWAAQGRHDQRVYPAHPAQEVVFTSGNASATSLRYDRERADNWTAEIDARTAAQWVASLGACVERKMDAADTGTAGTGEGRQSSAACACKTAQIQHHNPAQLGHVSLQRHGSHRG